MKHQINSFKFAFRGIWFTIKNECHMRFHMVAGFYVILFSFFYNLSKAQWAVILLLIASIMSAEIFNTCLEQLCNLNTQSYDPIARVAKDVAAGAVLVFTFVAVAVAYLFYFDLKTINSIVQFFLQNPILAVLLVLSFILSALFVGFGPLGAKRVYHKIKSKK
ncbi:MAG: diacylglycerol kinase family protein [Ruminococcus sp.]